MLHVKAGSLKELAVYFVTIIGDTVLAGFDAQASALSDLARALTDMTDTITDLREETRSSRRSSILIGSSVRLRPVRTL